MEPEDRSGRGIADNFAWFALGALIGVAAAVLVAPDKGTQTRRKLAGQVKAHRQTLVDSSQDMIGRGRDLFEKGREIAQEAAELFERGRKMAETEFDEQMVAEHIFERGL
jgi:gas vesicle protein